MGHGLAAMAFVVGAVEPGARYGNGLAAVKGGVFLDDACVQCGSTGDQLENASRLVQVAYRFIAPLGLLRQLQCSRTLLSAQGVHSLPGGIVVHHTGLVGVVGRCGGHGQNSPGVYVQYDAHPTGGNVMFLDGVAQGVFQIMLDVGIDGQPQTAAFDGSKLCFVALLQSVAPSIDCSQDYAV